MSLHTTGDTTAMGLKIPAMRRAILLAILLTPLAFWGCSSTHYKASADRAAYGLVKEKSAEVPNMESAFTIDQKQEDVLAGLPTVEKAEEAFGETGKAEAGAAIISLEKALAIAVRNGREYQSRKEALYLEALALSLNRREYKPVFSAKGSSTYRRSTRDETHLSDTARIAQAAPELIERVGELTGTPADLLSRYSQIVESAAAVTGLSAPETRIVDERSVAGNTALGVGLLLKGGAEIAASITSNFFRYLTGSPRVETSSALVASISQPLLRGAGSKVAAENLTQAERDLLYAVRDFTQFRKEFAVQIASDYYQVLQNRDAVLNNYLGYQAFQESVARQRALAAEGRVAQSDLGRIEQAALSNENSWVNSVRTYAQSLDRFKIRLGLSTDAKVTLDPQELEGLRTRGLLHPNISSEDAVKVALVTRLDLYTIHDREQDAQRKVKVAKNFLWPRLDLLATYQVDSVRGDRFQELDFERARWNMGLDVDLDLNRTSERNQYRASLISADRARRERELAEDNVKLDIRDAWRGLDQAKRNYEIQQVGMELNQRRVEEQTLLTELGRATAQDQVDAQNDLINARNQLTAALVSHTLARLRFWRDMGILYIKENGQWEEVTDVPKPQ